MKTGDPGTDWFDQCLAIVPEPLQIDVAEARLNLLAWGDRDSPALLFIHGGAAHAGWWRFIAPFFLPDCYCVAVDLSGHGHSSHRDRYPQGIWADEIAELVDRGDVFPQRPVLIGHSMGGLTALRVAAGKALPGLVVIDAAVRPEASAPGRRGRHNILGRERLYGSRQDALDRFRLIPPQPVLNPELVDYIAENSVRQTERGWTWLFDPNAFKHLTRTSLFDRLAEIRCPTALIRGECSRILDRETARIMSEEIAAEVVNVEIPAAHHHVMLDQPVALVSALRTVLATWQLTAK